MVAEWLLFLAAQSAKHELNWQYPSNTQTENIYRLYVSEVAIFLIRNLSPAKSPHPLNKDVKLWSRVPRPATAGES